jgi:hypothetical protein
VGVDVVLDQKGDSVQRSARGLLAPLVVESLGDRLRVRVDPEHRVDLLAPGDRSCRSGRDTDRQDLRSIQVFSAFWYLAYHVLFFLDLYLSGGFEQFEEGFVAPAPFTTTTRRRACSPEGCIPGSASGWVEKAKDSPD